MKIKSGRKNYEVFAFDVESHNDEESIARRETSIWLYSFIDEKSEMRDEANFGYTIDEFIDRLSRMTRHKRTKRNILIYVFHLAFEYSFLLPGILRWGLVWKNSIGEDDSYCFSAVTNKSCSSVWSVTLKFGKSGGVIEFRDLNKIFTGSLRSVAKSFGLETQKGDIDYKKNRLHDYTVTQAEKDYCFKDTKIVMEILEKLQGDKAFWKAVSAGSYSMRKMMEETYGRSWKPMQEYRKKFPILSQEESDFIRKGVSGGLTYPAPAYQYVKITRRIGHIDIHQAHPNSMAYRRFPCGVGTYGKGVPPRYRISLCRCKISYSGVKIHSLISQIGARMATDEEVYLWYPAEIMTAKKAYYDFEIKYIDFYAYEDTRLPWWKFLKGNYEKRMIAKAQGDKFLVGYYKLLNNSAYGKLIEWAHNEVTRNIINEDGVIDSIVEEKPKSEWRVAARYTYPPTGACVPMYTRCYLVESALTISPDGSDIVYVDTDSIFFIENESTTENLKKLRIGNDLGDWGIEETLVRAEFSAPKRYKALVESGRGDNFVLYDTMVHMAGINFSKEPKYDELDIDRGKFTIKGHLRCKGGTLIIDKEKVLDIQSKYLDIFAVNADNE